MMSSDETGLVTIAHFDATGTLVRENVSVHEALDLIDPPRPLDDDFHAELLALCHETDESIAKIGMIQFHAFLRADLETLVETLRDRPVSLDDATTVANEYITTRDAEPPEEPLHEDLPMYPPIPPFSGWVGLELLTEEERRDVIQAYRDEGNSDDEISQFRVIIDASAYRLSTIAWLAKMPKLEREPLLKATAKRLGLRVSTLAEEIAKAKKSGKAASSAQATSGQVPAAEAVVDRATFEETFALAKALMAQGGRA